MKRLVAYLAALFLILFYGQAVHAQTDLKHMVIAGYQGWFGTSCDSEYPTWRHWGASSPTPGNLTFELFPDMRDYAAGDVCATGLANLGNGSADTLYAAGRSGVINKHFEWMQTYNIDGIALQRFLVETIQSGKAVTPSQAWRDQTLQRVKTAAEATGRYFYLMIDISGASSSTLVVDFQADVLHVEGLSGNPLGSANYLKQNNKPVIAIWGCGFSDRPCTTTHAQTLITWLKGKGYYVYGGIPGWWNRTDVDPTQPTWQSTYFMFDMIAPWTVGGYPDDEDIDFYLGAGGQVATEKALAESNGVEYQVTMYPGYSVSNWGGGSQNFIPRRAGAMMWRQAYRIKERGFTNAYIGMFDEYDEAPAIAKAAEDSSMIPTNQYFLTLNADGTSMSSDFYLRLAGDATKMIKGQTTLTLTDHSDPVYRASRPNRMVRPYLAAGVVLLVLQT